MFRGRRLLAGALMARGGLEMIRLRLLRSRYHAEPSLRHLEPHDVIFRTDGPRRSGHALKRVRAVFFRVAHALSSALAWPGSATQTKSGGLSLTRSKSSISLSRLAAYWRCECAAICPKLFGASLAAQWSRNGASAKKTKTMAKGV
jgi:hypothetical protein